MELGAQVEGDSEVQSWSDIWRARRMHGQTPDILIRLLHQSPYLPSIYEMSSRIVPVGPASRS